MDAASLAVKKLYGARRLASCGVRSHAGITMTAAPAFLENDRRDFLSISVAQQDQCPADHEHVAELVIPNTSEIVWDRGAYREAKKFLSNRYARAQDALRWSVETRSTDRWAYK